MTVAEALLQIDALMPNAYSDAQKRRWLSEIEGIVADEIFSAMGGFSPYTEDDGEKELAVPEPYCDLYLKYMQAQMEFYHGDFERYNNAMAMFNVLYSAFAASHIRSAAQTAQTAHISL